VQRSVRSGQQVIDEDIVAEVDDFEQSSHFTQRQKVALRYADAITWDPTRADDAMWADLKRHFSEPELVELGYLIGVFAGGQRWIHTLQVQHGEVEAASTTGYRPELAQKGRV
jgi:alkylhydroperoxidase family enzyme